jgi:xanthine/CO dehydrogenase XdhC/CoxF family maturation factor
LPAIGSKSNFSIAVAAIAAIAATFRPASKVTEMKEAATFGGP